LTRLQNSFPPLGAFLLSLVLLSACEESGIVGSSFVSTDPSLQSDTLLLPSIETEQLVTFSGNKSNLAAGIFDDALFGQISATALVNPGIFLGSDTVFADASFNLVLQRSQIYGDTTATNVYELYELTRRWSGNVWKSDSIPPVDAAPLLTFETSAADSISIPLPASWSDRYRSFLDSTSTDREEAYRDAMFGFAIVPVSGGRVEYFPVTDAFLNIQNPGEQGEDDPAPITTGLLQRAISYTTTVPAELESETRLRVMNDFSSTARLTIRLNPDELPDGLISRAEVVLYDDAGQLEATLRPNEIRYRTGSLRLFEIEDDQKEFYITNNPISLIQREEDGRYRIGLTSYLNGAIRDGQEEIILYFTSDDDNGIISPNLFINAGDPERAPKLVITTINPS